MQQKQQQKQQQLQQQLQQQQQQHLCLNYKNSTLNNNFSLALPLRRIPFTETNGQLSSL